jgi:hypothetical protein
MVADYKNDDGHFHNTYDPRQVDTPTGIQPEDAEEPRRTVYSTEDPEGIEVDDRPQQTTSTRPSTSGKIDQRNDFSLFNMLSSSNRSTPHLSWPKFQRQPKCQPTTQCW